MTLHLLWSHEMVSSGAWKWSQDDWMLYLVSLNVTVRLRMLILHKKNFAKLQNLFSEMLNVYQRQKFIVCAFEIVRHVCRARCS